MRFTGGAWFSMNLREVHDRQNICKRSLVLTYDMAVV